MDRTGNMISTAYSDLHFMEQLKIQNIEINLGEMIALTSITKEDVRSYKLATQ